MGKNNDWTVDCRVAFRHTNQREVSAAFARENFLGSKECGECISCKRISTGGDEGRVRDVATKKRSRSLEKGGR